MKKSEVLGYFGGVVKTAAALGTSKNHSQHVGGRGSVEMGVANSGSHCRGAQI